MAVSPFRRLGMLYLALVAAILIAVEVAAPGTLARIFPALLAILLVAGFLSVVFLRSVAGRIRRLKQFADRAAAGDFTPLEKDHGRDELADLAQALGGTVARLGQSIHTLTEERNRSAAILGSMVEGVAVVAGDERILYCNGAFEQILELPEGSSQGKKLIEALRQVELVAAVRQVLPGGEEVTGEVEVGTVRPRSFAVTAAPSASHGSQERGAGAA